MGANLKYTDSQVRRNPDWEEIVRKYLDQYQGEFDYLVDMKMRSLAGYDLTVGMIRGVLNCMRHDPRVSKLPEPDYEDNVVELVQHKPKKKRRKWSDVCELFEAGIFHNHKRRLNNEPYCRGLYRINRVTTYSDAKFNGEVFAVGKSSQTILVHQVLSGQFTWHVNPHEYGWLYSGYSPTLSVKTGCKFPSWLTDPILLRAGHVVAYNSSYQDLDEIVKTAGQGINVPLQYCPRCFSEE